MTTARVGTTKTARDGLIMVHFKPAGAAAYSELVGSDRVRKGRAMGEPVPKYDKFSIKYKAGVDTSKLDLDKITTRSGVRGLLGGPPASLSSATVLLSALALPGLKGTSATLNLTRHVLVAGPAAG